RKNDSCAEHGRKGDLGLWLGRDGFERHGAAHQDARWPRRDSGGNTPINVRGRAGPRPRRIAPAPKYRRRRASLARESSPRRKTAMKSILVWGSPRKPAISIAIGILAAACAEGEALNPGPQSTGTG